MHGTRRWSDAHTRIASGSGLLGRPRPAATYLINVMTHERLDSSGVAGLKQLDNGEVFGRRLGELPVLQQRDKAEQSGLAAEV
jgi:hypothetical protein